MFVLPIAVPSPVINVTSMSLNLPLAIFARPFTQKLLNLLPKDTSIRSVLIIGSGPIIIGQACEFDYSGTQACKALRAEGYELVLVNSNPATIMTDPELADRTYIEPLTVPVITSILDVEKPDALLPRSAARLP